MKKNKKSKINFFTKGLFYFKKKDLDKSLFFFYKDIKAFPFHINSYYFIGKIYFLKREYQKAYSFFDICVKQRDENIYFNFYFGRTLLTLKRPREAIAYLENFAFQVNYGYFYLALAFYNLKEYQKSVLYFRKCPIELRERKLFKVAYSAALFNLGNIYYSYAKYSKAKEIYNEALEINKEAYPVYFQLGSIFLTEKNYIKAKTYFEFLYSNFPHNKSYPLILGYIYHFTKETKKLKAIIKQIEKDKFYPGITENSFKKILAYTLFDNRKYKEAIPIFLEIFRKRTYDEYTLFYLSQSRYYTNEFIKAINAFDLIFDITEKNVVMNNTYLLMLLENKKYDKVIEKATYFIENDFFNSKTVLYLFYAQMFHGNLKLFSSYYPVLKEEFANNNLFLQGVAYYFFETKNYDKALQTYYDLYESDPDDTYTLTKLVDIFTVKNKTEQALTFLKKIYNTSAKNEQIAFYYAFFLMKANHLEEAIKILKKIEIQQDKAAYMLSCIYFRKNDNKNGFIFLKRSFILNPIYLPIQFKSLLYFYKHKNMSQSLRICKLMRYTNPDFKRVDVYEALVFAKKDRYDFAAHRLETFIKKNSSSNNSYFKYLLACFYYKNNQPKNAKRLIKHLIRLNREQAPYIALLVLIAKKNYNLEEEKKLEKKLEKKFPSSVTTLEYRQKYIDINKTGSIIRKDIGIRLP